VDTIDPMRFILAFMFVLGLIGLMAVALRLWGKGGLPALGSRFAPKNESGRVQVVETRYLDARRRVVLLRRDDREHLVLLADGRELVLESFPAPQERKENT